MLRLAALLGASLDDILSLPPSERINTRYGVHTHMCGYDGDRRIAGCGHIWTHDGAVTQRITDTNAYMRLHVCPNCGRGPWTAIKPVRQ